MNLITYIGIGLLAMASCMAAELKGAVSGPVLGYTVRSGEVRPIVGIPGAAYFAPSVGLEGQEVAAVASEAAYAVMLGEERRNVRIISLRSGQTLGAVSDIGSPVRNVRLSASGTAAALVREGRVDILSGLPNHPEVRAEVEVPGDTVSVAVSDDGNALASFDGSKITVFENGASRQLASAQAVHDLRFPQGSRALIYIDGDSVMASSPEGLRRLAGGEGDNLLAPRAALLSRDGNVLWIADAASKSLLVLQPSGVVSESVKIPCIPTDLSFLSQSTLRLSCENASHVHVIELRPNGSRLVFIPEPVE